MKIFILNVRRSSWETDSRRYTGSDSTADSTTNWFQDTHILALFGTISFHQVEEVRLYGSMSGLVDELENGALTIFMSLLPRLPTTLRLLSCATCNLDVDCEKAILSCVETLRPHKVQFRKWNALNFAGNGTTRFAIAKMLQVFSSKLVYVMARQAVARSGIQKMYLVVESTADVATCEGLIPRLQNLKKLRIIRTAGNIPLPDIINSPKLKVVEIYLFSKLWTRGLHRDLINWLIQPTTWSQLRHLLMRMVPMHYHTATGLLDDPLPWSKLANVLNDRIRFPALQMVQENEKKGQGMMSGMSLTSSTGKKQSGTITR
ncbi:hypothetical protein EV368DRAFT_68917 [Lentinula lateritia]|nr:hypothetical protein EV368DRAFT_68917 [Lentinula lateritia]